MKIPLAVSSIGRISITASIIAPRCVGTVNFVVDTGSPYTFLSEKDAQRLRIPVKALNPDKELSGLTGKNFVILMFRSGSFTFLAEEGKRYTTKWPIRLRTYAGMGTIIQQEYPSILGTDFMKSNKFILRYDAGNDAACFEVKES